MALNSIGFIYGCLFITYILKLATLDELGDGVQSDIFILEELEHASEKGNKEILDEHGNHIHNDLSIQIKDVVHHLDICYDFSYGHPGEHTFSSPNYPSFYPDNVDCIKIIYAPDERHLIHVDFLEKFELESDIRGGMCNYDYLEVRDGAYGFSPTLAEAKYCGTQFPRRLTATSGAMWLRFKSDSILRYSGFKAVYSFEYVPPSLNASASEHLACNVTEHNDDGVISTDIARELRTYFDNSTNNDLDCLWKIETRRPGFQIRLFFENFELAFPNNCHENFLLIYHTNTAASRLISKYCGMTATNLVIPSTVAIIRMFLRRDAIEKSSIRLVYTVFTSAVHSSDCFKETPFLYRCKDETCIPKPLECNGHQNCMFNDDESHCVKKKTSDVKFVSGPYLAILIAVCLIIGVIITIAGILNLCPRFHKAYEVGVERGRKSVRRMALTLRERRLRSKYGGAPDYRGRPEFSSVSSKLLDTGVAQVQQFSNNQLNQAPLNNTVHVTAPLDEHILHRLSTENLHSFLKQKDTGRRPPKILQAKKSLRRNANLGSPHHHVPPAIGTSPDPKPLSREPSLRDDPENTVYVDVRNNPNVRHEFNTFPRKLSKKVNNAPQPPAPPPPPKPAILKHLPMNDGTSNTFPRGGAVYFPANQQPDHPGLPNGHAVTFSHLANGYSPVLGPPPTPIMQQLSVTTRSSGKKSSLAKKKAHLDKPMQVKQTRKRVSFSTENDSSEVTSNAASDFSMFHRANLTSRISPVQRQVSNPYAMPFPIPQVESTPPSPPMIKYPLDPMSNSPDIVPRIKPRYKQDFHASLHKVSPEPNGLSKLDPDWKILNPEPSPPPRQFSPSIDSTSLALSLEDLNRVNSVLSLANAFDGDCSSPNEFATISANDDRRNSTEITGLLNCKSSDFRPGAAARKSSIVQDPPLTYSNHRPSSVQKHDRQSKDGADAVQTPPLPKLRRTPGLNNDSDEGEYDLEMVQLHSRTPVPKDETMPLRQDTPALPIRKKSPSSKDELLSFIRSSLRRNSGNRKTSNDKTVEFAPNRNDEVDEDETKEVTL